MHLLIHCCLCTFQVYADNKVLVEKHMKEYAEGKHTFTLALNKFADFTSKEFSRLFKGVRVGSTRPHATHQVAINRQKAPSSDMKKYCDQQYQTALQTSDM